MRPHVLHSHSAALFGHDRDHPLRERGRGPEPPGTSSLLSCRRCASYLMPTTSLTFSVRGFFSSCSLLRRCSSCRWRASSSISLLSVTLRASLSRLRSL